MQFQRTVRSIHFYKEQIALKAGEGALEVHATYYYRNLTCRDIDLLAKAPFPVNHTLSFPHRISLVEGDNIPVMWERAGNTIKFCMFFSPGENKKMTLIYTQKNKGYKGSYILITTKSWRRPLCRGDYSLELPKNCSIVYSSYPLNRATSSEDCSMGKVTSLLFSMEDFMPRKNWDFSYQWGQ